MYKCGNCGLGVIVIPNQEPIKACSCTAPITVDMSATTTGFGGIKN
jgi:hypothetical protein